MHFDDNEAALLKKWTIKKLEDISDADSEVLADYVLALIRNDDTNEVARANCIENLRDFLPDNVGSFVNDVFKAIATKSYDPSRPPSKPTARVYAPPRRGSFEPPKQSNESRKRSYHDWDTDDQQHGRTLGKDGSDRPVKQPRRGGRVGHGQRGGQPVMTYNSPAATAFPFAPDQMAHMLQMMPTPPAGMPPFDINNPLAALLAMQQAMGLMPGLSNSNTSASINGSGSPRSGQRCKDYDKKGFCAKGANCPYEHGEDPYVVPLFMDEYDPHSAALFDTSPARSRRLYLDSRNKNAGKGRGWEGARDGARRAPFSQAGQMRNRETTTIVVEQIPEDHFDEQAVRAFFGDFGAIEEVKMRPYKHLAIIKFTDHDAARAAYNSPKAVFDNRFVKVYWFKQEKGQLNEHALNGRHHIGSRDTEVQEGEGHFDTDEFASRQQEAQRRYEEARKQRIEIEDRKKQLDDELKAMERERTKLATELAKRTGEPVPDQAQESEQTKALKAQLAKLEAEAKSLGIDTENIAPSYEEHQAPIRGRGSFRGRTRGRGQYASHRGGWAGAVMRLDNRPKTVCVTFENGSYGDHDEALRQFLMLNSMDTAALSRHPDRDNVALIAFSQRYEAENFIAVGSDLPYVGKVELSWHVPNEKLVAAVTGYNNSDIDVKIDVGHAPATARQEERPLRDMDTYDETDDYA